LLRGLLPPEYRDLNLEVVYGGETRAEEILSRAETLPLLSSRRVIVVRDADRLPSKDQERVVDRLEKHPCPHVCVIFLAQRIDRKGSLFRAFQKVGKTISCDLANPEQIREWLEERARQKGKRLSPSAIEALYESVGDDPNLLAGELERIILLVGMKKEIQREDVLAQVGRRMHHIFEVMDALGYGKAEDALQGFRSLLEHGEEPLSILGMISRHFRLLSKVKQMDLEGKPQDEMARHLRIPQPYLRSLLSHAKAIPWKALEGFFDGLLRCDSFLKSERGLGTLEIERLILGFCRQVSKVSRPEKTWQGNKTGESAV
jgi:DNA polymerase-3 subunit delta